MNIENYATINQVQAHARTSEKYSFIPTKQVLDVLGDHGWYPAKIRETKTRTESNEGFQKHLIRLRSEAFNRQLMVGEEIPEIILINSHMGSASFQLSGGMYRCVCSNQLCVPSSTIEEFRIRHQGYTDDQVADAMRQLLNLVPKALESAETMRQITLERPEQEAFARAAIEMRFDEDGKYVADASQFLRARRYSDSNNNSLWTTFNNVQENMIKGRVPIYNKEKRRHQRTRAINGIDQNTALNRGLWRLAEEMKALKTA